MSNLLLQSSQDPNKLSMTIKGYLIMILPIVIELAQSFNVIIKESVAVEWIQMVSFSIALIVSIAGILRKLWKIKA